MPRAEAAFDEGLPAGEPHRTTAAGVVRLLEARHAPAAPGQYAIVLAAHHAFFAIDDAARPALLIAVAEGATPVGREVGGLSLHHERAMQFRVTGTIWTAPAMVITCAERTLLPTFAVLALDVAARVAERQADGLPRARDVSDAVGEWERLLRARRSLTVEEEIGLWGELWLLSHMSDVDAAVHAWKGPSDPRADFLFDGRSLECKTTTQRLRHHVSQPQVERPFGDLAAHLVSLWVGTDQSGTSLPELVHRVDVQLADTTAFETKLLQAGYSRADAGAYRERWVLLAPPLVYGAAAVPRVRQWDAGISAIRYTVQLDEDVALEPAEAATLLSGPGQGFAADQRAGDLGAPTS